MPLNCSQTHLKRFPFWLRQSVKFDENIKDTARVISNLSLHTVCREARCPNIYRCFSEKRCTFLILGDVCTRGCGFCSVKKGPRGSAVDRGESERIRRAVMRLGVQEVILTSVTRDDLPDGGASQFSRCVKELRRAEKSLHIEILTPDFKGEPVPVREALRGVPDVFSHNIETVPRLYRRVRPESDYRRSLGVIELAKRTSPDIFVQSGLMVGFGETQKEVRAALRDLRFAGCDGVTIGQYLKPAPECLDVERFVRPEEFFEYSDMARSLGFKKVKSYPFARSSSPNNT